MIELTGHALDHGWVPHKPETWKYHYARLRHAVDMYHYRGEWRDGEPVFDTVPCGAGQPVKIVMVSRFGDVGVTEDLSAENGYGARLRLDDLYDFSVGLPADIGVANNS